MDRKARLEKLLKSSKSERILYAQHIERGGKELFAEVCSYDLEGIVAKGKLGTYKDAPGTGPKSRTQITPRAKADTAPKLRSTFSDAKLWRVS